MFVASTSSRFSGPLLVLEVVIRFLKILVLVLSLFLEILNLTCIFLSKSSRPWLKVLRIIIRFQIHIKKQLVRSPFKKAKMNSNFLIKNILLSEMPIKRRELIRQLFSKSRRRSFNFVSFLIARNGGASMPCLIVF